MIPRFFSSSPRRWSRPDLGRQIEQLLKAPVPEVPEVPVKPLVALSSQELGGKGPVDLHKTPLVMIHGLFGARQNYASVGRKIGEATGRRVIGLDMRNHGSSEHAMPHDYDHMTSDTIRYLERLEQPVVLAGHLMGAKVSMLVALRRPDLVERLVVIDNVPVTTELDSQFTADLVAMCTVERDLHHKPGKQAAFMKEVDQVMAGFEPSPLVRLFLMSNLKRPQHRDRLEPARFRVPVRSFLKHGILEKMGAWPKEESRYSGPVLVMRGLRSPFVLDQSLEEHFPRYFPNTTVSDFDCGHWLVSEQPDVFVERMRVFLENSLPSL